MIPAFARPKRQVRPKDAALPPTPFVAFLANRKPACEYTWAVLSCGDVRLRLGGSRCDSLEPGGCLEALEDLSRLVEV